MTEELQPLTLQDRGEARTLDLSTPEGVKQFKDGFIENAAKGKGIDRLQYFQGLLILDVSGVLEQDPNLQKAVIKSGQDPLIWQGVYMGVKNSAEVLKNPDASPQQRQTARQNLQAYFRITEITHMETPPNYQDPAVRAKVYPVWRATWKGLNSWRPLLEEEVTPPAPPTPAGTSAEQKQLRQHVRRTAQALVGKSSAEIDRVITSLALEHPDVNALDLAGLVVEELGRHRLHNPFRQLAKYYKTLVERVLSAKQAEAPASAASVADEPVLVPPGTGLAQPAASAQPPAPDSKTRKLSWIEQIGEVVHIERIQAPDLEGDIEGAVAELEKQVTARSIFGKFPPEVRIKDRVFHHNNARDFTDFGDDEVGSFWDTKKVHIDVLGIIYNLLHGRRDSSPDFQEFAKKHFLMAVNIPGTPDAILSYQFLQNWRDSVRRPASVVAMNFRLRRESAYELLGLVRKDPEAAEMFLQKAADGFEAEDPNSPKVGIPRVTSEEIVILNLDNFNPDHLNSKIYTYQRTMADEIVQNLKGQTETYRYSRPHGIADPNTIPL